MGPAWDYPGAQVWEVASYHYSVPSLTIISTNKRHPFTSLQTGAALCRRDHTM